MTSSVTVRLSDEQVAWLRSSNGSVSDGVRAAIDRAMQEASYLKAQRVLARVPLSDEDEWGDLEDFMLRAAPNER